MISFKCQCGRTCQAPDSAAGKKVKCPGCGTILHLKAPSQSPADSLSRPSSAVSNAPQSNASPRTQGPSNNYPSQNAPTPPSARTPVAPTSSPLPNDPFGMDLQSMLPPANAMNSMSYPSAPAASYSSPYSRNYPTKKSSSNASFWIGISIFGSLCFLGLVAGVSIILFARPNGANAQIARNGASPSENIAGSTSSSASTATNSSLTPSVPAKPKIVLDDAKLLAIAQTFVDGLNTNSRAKVDSVFDSEMMIKKVLNVGFPVDNKTETNFAAGMRNGITQRGVWGELLKALANGGVAKIVGLRTIKNERCVLLRINAMDNVMYSALYFDQDAVGQTKICDAYQFANGEEITESMRKMYIQFLSTRGSLFDKLTGREKAQVDKLKAFMKLAELKGQPARSVQAFEALPEDQKNNKMALLLYVQAAMALDEEQYAKAIEEFRRRLPDDPSVEMQSIDLFIIRKKFDEALAAIDRLDKSLGGDPYLDAMRAGVYAIKGDLKKANEFRESAIERDPDLAELLEE